MTGKLEEGLVEERLLPARERGTNTPKDEGNEASENSGDGKDVTVRERAAVDGNVRWRTEDKETIKSKRKRDITRDGRRVDQHGARGYKQEGKLTTKKEVEGNQTRGVKTSLLLHFASVSHAIVPVRPCPSVCAHSWVLSFGGGRVACDCAVDRLCDVDCVL